MAAFQKITSPLARFRSTLGSGTTSSPPGSLSRGPAGLPPQRMCGLRGPNPFGLSHRFAKLLLRLPALRSIGLKCLEHLFFFKLIGDTPIDTFLMEMLEAPHQLA